MEYKVQSLAKAIKVLECFTVAKPEWGVSEVARFTGFQKSTVHNILTTLQQLGYVEQNPETQRYYLGLKILQFSRVVNTHIGLSEMMGPYMQKIGAATQEMVYLAIPYGSDVIYISSYADGSHASPRAILGERAPMYCTGIGKAILAYLDDAESRIPAQMQAFTPDTITDKQALLRDLAWIRAHGYALDNMEHEFGVKCVAVPIFAADESVRCAVSISGPSLRFAPSRVEAMAKTMMEILAPIQHKA
ncbi:MAG TPA: IclR family transcriptional regulator [Candidatus Alectryocaccomicrobium excrementavium]|uniref:Glycerol operon regulatory protein n=1 Tax=Candidatus Alectryocaccomicrobium excrementavium TaxID=2840668 RepID=A0A9D1K571_9FIRM|nr:IclR family transcriptional regulator [Candidatus Alectryocaccomicrobium excrementavium]